METLQNPTIFTGSRLTGTGSLLGGDRTFVDRDYHIKSGPFIGGEVKKERDGNFYIELGWRKINLPHFEIDRRWTYDFCIYKSLRFYIIFSLNGFHILHEFTNEGVYLGSFLTKKTGNINFFENTSDFLFLRRNTAEGYEFGILNSDREDTGIVLRFETIPKKLWKSSYGYVILDSENIINVFSENWDPLFKLGKFVNNRLDLDFVGLDLADNFLFIDRYRRELRLFVFSPDGKEYKIYNIKNKYGEDIETELMNDVYVVESAIQGIVSIFIMLKEHDGDTALMELNYPQDSMDDETNAGNDDEDDDDDDEDDDDDDEDDDYYDDEDDYENEEEDEYNEYGKSGRRILARV